MSSAATRAASAPLRRARQAWRLQFQDSARSLALAERALEAARSAGDVDADGWARLSIGLHRLRHGRMADAYAEFSAAARSFESNGDRRGAILAHTGIARCQWREGRVREALSLVMGLRNEGMQTLKHAERGMLLNVIAGCYSSRGDSPEAFAYLYQALRELRSARDRGLDAVLFCNLAHELLQLGDYYEALNYVDEGIERCSRIANDPLLVVLLLNRVICLADLDLLAEAMNEVERLESLLAASGGNNVEAYAAMASTAVRAGRLDVAARLLAVAASQEVDGVVAEERLVLAVARAEVARANGELESAWAALQAAEPLPIDGVDLRTRCLYFQLRATVQEERGDAQAALADLRRWQALHQDRALMASKGRYQAASLQTELMRLRQQRDDSEARRRASERAKAELQSINDKLSIKVREVEALQIALQDQAVRDFLTGLFNRRHLNDALPPLHAMAERHREPLALAVIDLDHFKQVNDVHGHMAGDRVLASFGHLLLTRLRRSDIACRYGGEEFCVVMPRTSAAAAQAKLDSLLAIWRSMHFELPGGTLRGLSFSIGVADSQLVPGSSEALLAAADDCVLRAKQLGRGRAVVAAARWPLARELTP